MQRTVFRAVIFAAVGAVAVVLVDDTQAGHRRRGGCGSSGGYYNGYSGGYSYGYSGGKYGYTKGGNYGGASSSGYRGVSPGVQTSDTYETPETGVIGGAGGYVPPSGPFSPSDRIAPGVEGTIRGGADASPSLRGNAITPRAAPPPAPIVPAAPAPGVPTPAAPPPPAPET